MNFILILILLLTTLTHEVEPSRIFKSGIVKINTLPTEKTDVEIVIDYNLKPKWYVPIGDQVGTFKTLFPSELLTEKGYQELKDKGFIYHYESKISYLGKATVKGFKNCHKILIERYDKTWRATVYYHPSVHSLGWVKMILYYKNKSKNNNIKIKTYLYRAIEF